MRGDDGKSGNLFSYVDLDDRVPKRHPLRLIRAIVNDVLADLSEDFSSVYSAMGRPSIAPEKLLRALLLQAFYSIRSERQLMEQLDFNLLYRWFVGLGIDDGVWDASTFCKNRDRLLEAEIAAKFLSGIIAHKRVARLLSRDHFSVDGTLIEAWSSMKSFRPKDQGDDDGSTGGRNQEQDFHGQTRSNASHASVTDPDARLHRKGNGKESRLCYMGHALMENRHGLVVGGGITLASGTAEREAALEMIDKHRPQGIATGGKASQRRITLGGDKGYDVSDFVDELRARQVTPHIAVQDHLTKTGKRRKTRIDGRTTRQPGYLVSQRIRKRIEEIFGWIKESAGLRQSKFRGRARVNAQFTLALAAFNLIRLPKLLEAPP
ncbi:MAG: IS5 family transposase [Alphaproteobacteria bacterium]|jgi:transposase/translation initiation factor 1 (eIF-1/SUI1)|nr:IS5 family transposase [Alphaproteobacteria bacterium]